MQLPTQITLSNVPQSAPLGDHIRGMSWRLGCTFPEIRNCRVRLERILEPADGMDEFHAQLRVRIAGRELLSGASHGASATTAVRNAFAAMRRQLTVAVQRDRDRFRATA